jgi:hypothetical protein
MAQYRFSPKIVSRGSGQSVIAKAAYNAREAIRDDRTGEMKDYSRGKGLEFSGIFAPKNAPEWMKDRAQLWNAVELQEDGTTRHATAQLARYIELSLPHELNADQRRQLVRDFVREQFVRQGMVADVAIHAPHAHGDERNYHAHILLTLREIDGDGFSADKARHWNSKELNLQWREKWAEVGARYLAKAGFEQEAERYSYSHLTLKEQFREAARRGDLAHAETLDREPTKHLGPQAAAMERRGVETERGQLHSETVEANKLRAELRDIEKQIQAEQRKPEHTAEPKEHGQRPGVVDFALDEERIKPQPKGRDAREIHAAFDESNRPKPFRGDAFRTKAFMAALDKEGIALASVTKEEAARTRAEAASARKAGKYAPSYREGEIVAVTLQGTVHRLNERTTGLDTAALETRLQKLDRSKLQGLDATKVAMTERAAQHRVEVTAERMERAREPRDYGRSRKLDGPTKKAPLKDPLKLSMRVLQGIGNVASKVAELLVAFFDPGPPKTRVQIETAIEDNKRHRHAAEKDAAATQQKAANDHQHGTAQAKQADAAAQEQRQREEYRRLRGDDRDRER